ncbi:MAG: nucleotidyltransferase family protein [Bacteroidota bacterium]
MRSNQAKVLTIVLAAGESRRMGVPKLLLPVFGTTMLRHTVMSVMELGPTIVVTGAYSEQTRRHLKDMQGITFAHNPRWREGMSSSLAVGVRVASMFRPLGYLVTVADQPGMSIEGLEAHCNEFVVAPDSIVATAYPEGPGVPAIFPARLTSALVSAEGKIGARRLIRQEGEMVRVIHFQVPPQDVDTPEDYERLTGHRPPGL